MNFAEILQVKIVSPKQDFYNGPSLAVSSINSAGPFDVLPQHANFITIVQNQPITVQVPGRSPLVFHFPLAIIYVSQNKVSIYTDIQIQLKI